MEHQLHALSSEYEPSSNNVPEYATREPPEAQRKWGLSASCTLERVMVVLRPMSLYLRLLKELLAGKRAKSPEVKTEETALRARLPMRYGMLANFNDLVCTFREVD